MSEETNGIKCETVEALLDARRNANGILASAKNLKLIRDAVAGAAADPSAPGSAAKLLTAVDCLDDLINAAEGRDLLKATFPRRIFLKPAARKAVAK